MHPTPIVISIAGYDPSGGAGVVADMKVLDRLGIIGCSAITAITYQNDIEVANIEWLSMDKIIAQLDILLKRFNPEWIKIGMIESISTLNTICDYLLLQNPNCKIVWDTVLKTSSGHTSFNQDVQNQLPSLLQKIYLITPNFNEVTLLGGIENLYPFTNLVVKGGHSTDKLYSTDLLYLKGNPNPKEYTQERILYQKHGSGCIFSSALCGYLSVGYEIEISVSKAKFFTFEALKSSHHLLAKFNLINP